MLEFLTLKTNIFGLEVSDSSIKVAELKKSNNGLKLSSWKKSEISQGLFEDGEIKDEKKLSEEIKKTFLSAKIKTEYVVSCLPETKSFLQAIKMPKMEKEELESAVFLEAENHIPFSINEVYLDFEIISEELNSLDILIAALPKKIVDPYVSCLKNASLVPYALEIEPYSLARSLVERKKDNHPMLLIDFKENSILIAVFLKGAIRFTLTSALSQPIEKIKKCIDYYHAHFNNKIEKIVCSGKIPENLPEQISKAFEISTSLGNPWVNILKEPIKEVPSLSFKDSLEFATVLGLALRKT